MKKLLPSILQELESDDELPDSYNDIPMLPAYLDDNRFDQIEFPWVNNVNLNYKHPQPKIDCNNSQRHIVMFPHKGVLRGQDLYCLKSVEPFTCGSTLIWFVNFLMLKDLQSQYNYLKSCLVNDPIPTIPLTNKKHSQYVKVVPNAQFEILIKT